FALLLLCSLCSLFLYTTLFRSLVIPDEGSLRVGGERRLPRARQAEEQRDIACPAEVGGAVHREHAALGQQVVEDGKHRLLHLPRDRKSTRLNSSHQIISYAVFC